MYINIEILEDFNNLKAETQYQFDFSNFYYYLIVGNNGCGKSSLLNSIRATKCDNADMKLSNWEAKVGYQDIAKYKDSVKITTDFEKILFLSSEFDDPLSLNNAASAQSFIANGGFGMRTYSNGQKSMQLLGKWKVENEKSFTESTLIVFDEIDKGFDIETQPKLLNLMTNLNRVYGVKFLTVSHHSLPILLTDKVYWFEMKKLISPERYLLRWTGYMFKSPNKMKENE